MTSHILFPCIEPDKLPATMSAKILKGLLRTQLGFNGLILSDGMEMEAVKARFGIPQGCRLALSAGVDIVFLCIESPDMEASLREVGEAYAAGMYDSDEFDASVERILSFKKKFAHSSPRDLCVSGFTHEHIAEKVKRLTLSTLASNADNAPPLGDRPFFVGCLASRSTLVSNDPDTLSFPRWFAARFGGSFRETPLNPASGEISAIVSELSAALSSELPLAPTSIVLGTYNGHLNPGQPELARALCGIAKQRGIPFLCLAFRNPWDISLLPATYGLALWEYTEQSFEAAAAVLCGEYIPSGKLPVIEVPLCVN